MYSFAGLSIDASNGFPSWRCIFLALALIGLAGCGEAGGGKQEYAYVSAPEAELHDRVAPMFSKTGVVHNGERVSILERMTNRRYVRVRSSGGEEGWIPERYLTDQRTFDQLQQLAEQFKNAPTQATAVTTKPVNLHALPGRRTEHLYQLAENSKVDLLQRQVVDKNAVPGAQQKSDKKEADSESGNEESSSSKSEQAAIPEDWWLIRDPQKRVGWVLGRMLYLDIPIDVAQYAEGQRIVAFFVLDQVQDEGKSVPEYLLLLAENKDGLPYDYDQVRVFTWNVRRHRYETAYRERSLSGFLPVALARENFAKEGDLRTFTLHLADDSGQIHEQKYKFVPPLVRLVLAPGETPAKTHHKAGKAKRQHS